MKRDLRIEQARQFAKKILSGNYKDITKEDYHLLLVSKFILLKESIMKTNENHDIFFDCRKYQRYLAIILYISNTILKTNKVNGIDINKVEISPSSVAYDKLKEYIWIFNKLRDCLGHGKYELNSEENKIILKNPPYMNNLAVPIELLEMFNYLVETKRSNISQKAYHEYNGKIKRKILINGNYSNDNNYLIEYKKYMLNNNIETYQPYYDHQNLLHNTNEINIYTVKDRLSYLIWLIKNSSSLSKQDKEKYLASAYEIASKLKEYASKHSKNSEYREKLVETMQEIAKLIGMCSKPVDFISLCAIYNYASQVLTNKAEAIKGNKISSTSLGRLKMSKLGFRYVKKEHGNTVLATNSRLTPKNHNIEKLVLQYIKNANKDFAEYKNTRNYYKRKNIIERYDKFYSDLLGLLGDRNKEIILSLRNATEHGNVKDANGLIYLYDQSDHTDDDTINFECNCDIDTFYEMMEDIDLGRNNNDFTFEELLGELEQIISTEIYNELKDTIRNVNELKLISILKQVSRK